MKLEARTRAHTHTHKLSFQNLDGSVGRLRDGRDSAVEASGCPAGVPLELGQWASGRCSGSGSSTP